MFIVLYVAQCIAPSKMVVLVLPCLQFLQNIYVQNFLENSHSSLDNLSLENHVFWKHSEVQHMTTQSMLQLFKLYYRGTAPSENSKKMQFWLLFYV